MRRNHLDAVAAQLLIEWIAVVSAIADQILRLGLAHVEVEKELNQTHFVGVGRMRTAKLAAMKHSSSFSAPRSRSSLAMSVKTWRRISLRHQVWKRRCTVL